MRQYFLYIGIGLIQVLFLAMLGGMATWINPPWPYIAMAGSFTLLLVAGPISLFYEKLATFIAIFSALLSLLPSIRAGILSEKSGLVYFAISLLPIIIFVDAYFRLQGTSDASWFVLRMGPNYFWKVTLVIIPLLLFSGPLFRSLGILDKNERELWLIPKGYQGRIRVIFERKDGKPIVYEKNKTRVYKIPTDGILRTQFERSRGYIESTFVYVDSSGQREPIEIFDAQKKPSADSVGVFLGGSGVATSSAKPVSIPFSLCYVTAYRDLESLMSMATSESVD